MTKFNVFRVCALYYRKTINHQQNAQRGFFLTCNTLLHVSTLLGHLQGELFVVVTLRLHFIIELLTVYCIAYGGANPLWSQLALHINGVCLECALVRGAVRSRNTTRNTSSYQNNNRMNTTPCFNCCATPGRNLATHETPPT
jgi:hypothetical protein